MQRKPVEIARLVQKKKPEDEEALQAEELEGKTPEVSASLEGRIASLNGGGSALPESARSFFEPRFGSDFRAVRVHTDAGAGELARSVNAHAFTVGRDIVFGSGRYAPETEPGKRLLAHELTHVVQQGSGKLHGQGGDVQRFESDEHQQMGNAATGSSSYNLATAAGDTFELTHGDIVALSGDIFGVNELFDLAKIPGKKGQAVGTRDEILWALQDTRIWEMRGMPSGPFAGKKDPRFEPGGPYAGYTYSDAVKNAVFERYQKLGAANTGHFVSPQGRNASGAPLSSSESTGPKYRIFHEAAIKEADKAGRAKLPIDQAMAREAAAQHFLTDEFSSGHLRTPAGAIREYWNNKYPLFWYNLRHKIAMDTAKDMWVPTTKAYPKILAKVEAMAGSLPAVTLGDLLSSVFHDVDNEQGIAIAGGGKVMGDKHLDAGTQKLAIAAIQAGNKDIQKAYAIGQQMPTPVPDADLFAQVRLTSGGQGDKYAPELQVPEPDKGLPAQNWSAPDINTLWDQPLLGTSGDTVGQVISTKVQGGSIAIQLNSLAEKFPVDEEWSTHPRASYLNGFVRNLQANPKAGVLNIVNWVPEGFAASQTVDDLAAKGAAGDKKDNIGNMLPEQRLGYLRALMKNGQDPDKEAVIKLFEGLPVPERQGLYKALEGHDWAGDFQRKVGSRDEIYKFLDGKRVERLKDVVNG